MAFVLRENGNDGGPYSANGGYLPVLRLVGNGCSVRDSKLFEAQIRQNQKSADCEELSLGHGYQLIPIAAPMSDQPAVAADFSAASQLPEV
jgi:hypothetical protein